MGEGAASVVAVSVTAMVGMGVGAVVTVVVSVGKMVEGMAVTSATGSFLLPQPTKTNKTRPISPMKNFDVCICLLFNGQLPISNCRLTIGHSKPLINPLRRTVTGNNN